VVHDRPVSELPGWLAEALNPPPPPHPRPVTTWQSTPVPAGRVAAYVRAVVQGEAANVAAAQVGGRHTTLLAAARRLGHWVGGKVLPEAEAVHALTAAAAHYVGVAGYTAAKVEQTIIDGIAYGARLPRGPHDIPDRPEPDDHANSVGFAEPADPMEPPARPGSPPS
jgi:hypothetical protein